MSHKKKRNIIIATLCGVLLLMIVGYAAFQSVLKIKGTTTINSNWNVHITNVEEGTITGMASTSLYKEGDKEGQKIMEYEDLTATFSADLQSPGDSIEYVITVSNDGSLNAKLDKITISDPDNDAITFETSGLKETDIISANDSKTLTVKVTFKDIKEGQGQPTNKIGTIKVTLDFSQANVDEGGIAIPQQNAASTLIEKVTTTGDGLYEDSTEAGRYVYKGTNPDNYITFNNETWRIVAVESDETLKIMKNESLGQKQFDTPSGRYQSSTGYCNSQYGCNVWGSTSTMLDTNGNIITTMPRKINETAYALPTTESQMTTFLKTYYGSTNLSTEAKNQIESHLWNVGLIDNVNQSVETVVAKEKTNKWNGNVGLINPSDYMKASANINCTSSACNANNYMKKSYYWWTMSPASNNEGDSNNVWYIDMSFGVSYTSAVNGVEVYPVVYLNSNIKIAGEGTTAAPYTISS